MRNFRPFLAACSGALLFASAPALADDFKPGVDANGDGALTLEEFAMAMADRDLRRFDRNDDDAISITEWTATGGQFQQNTADRFNADNDDYMSAVELVEIYSWIFGNRDKNKNGLLEKGETPPFLMEG